MQFSVTGCFVVLLVIFTTGVLGGFRNWISEREVGEDLAPKSNAKPLFLAGKIIDGIIAAAAVPLFLSVIGNEKTSAVFGKIRFGDADYEVALFVLVGFCSLAGAFSQRFLESLSKKVMQLNEKVERVAQKVEQTNVVAEAQIESDAVPNATKAASGLTDQLFTDLQKKLLRALFKGQFLMRSITGISETTGLTIREVGAGLSELASLELVRKVPTSKGDRWALTDQGRGAAASTPA